MMLENNGNESGSDQTRTADIWLFMNEPLQQKNNNDQRYKQSLHSLI